MSHKFPTEEWVKAFHDKLNSDEAYARIAKTWEGDISLVIEPDDAYELETILYFDLWHGESRDYEILDKLDDKTSDFVISAPFTNWLRILEKELNPVQALATMKLKVKGNLTYIMRNVPTVLEFARCAQETPFHL